MEKRARATPSAESRPRDGLLVAVGAQSVEPEPGDEYCNARRMVWVSSDAETCTTVEPSGLAEGDYVATDVGGGGGAIWKVTPS
jgi:hypothetical protein